ncbi:MAG UNVERIFIED_CONTAM: helix-turn-helix transcriptional regulator [Rickettsiaceae bacterium]
MSLFKKLDKHIKEHYSSIGAFETKNSIPKNTVRRLFTRQTENTTINTLINIAKVLNCSIDELLDLDSLSNPEGSNLNNEDLDSRLIGDILGFISAQIEQNQKIDHINKKRTIQSYQ